KINLLNKIELESKLSEPNNPSKSAKLTTPKTIVFKLQTNNRYTESRFAVSHIELEKGIYELCINYSCNVIVIIEIKNKYIYIDSIIKPRNDNIIYFENFGSSIDIIIRVIYTNNTNTALEFKLSKLYIIKTKHKPNSNYKIHTQPI